MSIEPALAPVTGVPGDAANWRVGYLLLIPGAALFGIGGSVSKVVLEAGIAPARLAALRCTLGALVLVAVLAVVSPARLRLTRREVPTLALLGLSGAALIQWLYFVAIDRLPVGIALLLEFTAPAIVAVYSRLVLGTQLPRRVWLAIGVALGGLALVAQVWRDTGLDPVGVLAGFGAAACLAVFYLLGKHSLARRDPISLSCWILVFASLFWAVAQPWWDFDLAVLTERTSMLGALDSAVVPVWVPLAWVVILGTLVPYALEMGALHHLSPTTTGVVGMLEPVVAAGFAWWWLGESLGAVQIAGAVFVLAGIAVVQATPPPVPPVP
jgi:drug/metabolite transporter (DMT)-like permease